MRDEDLKTMILEELEEATQGAMRKRSATASKPTIKQQKGEEKEREHNWVKNKKPKRYYHRQTHSERDRW